MWFKEREREGICIGSKVNNLYWEYVYREVLGWEDFV